MDFMIIHGSFVRCTWFNKGEMAALDRSGDWDSLLLIKMVDKFVRVPCSKTLVSVSRPADHSSYINWSCYCCC